MLVSSFGSVLLAWSAAQEPTPAGDVLLATVPEKLAIAGESVWRSNFGSRTSRSSIAWSADGKRVAYAAVRGDDWLPVVGAEVGEAFDYVSRPSLAGEHVFFHVANRRSASKQQCWLWVDGKKIGREDWMGDITVRADGKAVAYWTQPGAKSEDVAYIMNPKNILVVASDGGGGWSFARGEPWFACSSVPPVFSTDGKHVLTTAVERDKGWRVIQAGKKEALLTDPFPAIESFALSADAGALAFVRTKVQQAPTVYPRPTDDAQLVFKGKRLARGYAVVAMPAVDARGAHVAYVIQKQQAKTFAVALDEQEPFGAYDYVFDLTFDPRGERLAFVANTGGMQSTETPGEIVGGAWFVVERSVDGQTEPREHAHALELRDLTWDARGERLAYAARDETGWCIVCGDARSEAHTDVGTPCFAADVHSLGFGSRDGRELWWRTLVLP